MPGKGKLVIDLETSGLTPPSARITEVGLIAFDGWKILEIFQTVVDPEIPIPTHITNITGLTTEMVKGFPKIQDLGVLLDKLYKKYIFYSYQSSFEMKFLNFYLGINKFNITDVMVPAAKAVGNGRWLKLGEVAAIMGLPTPSHRALDDCLTCYHIVNRLGL